MWLLTRKRSRSPRNSSQRKLHLQRSRHFYDRHEYKLEQVVSSIHNIFWALPADGHGLQWFSVIECTLPDDRDRSEKHVQQQELLFNITEGWKSRDFSVLPSSTVLPHHMRIVETTTRLILRWYEYGRDRRAVFKCFICDACNFRCQAHARKSSVIWWMSSNSNR